MTMATTMDALTSFNHLVDNLPLWLLKLDGLSTQVTEHHARFMKLTYSTERKLARQKTGSTESLRPNEEGEITEDHKGTPAQATGITISPEEPPQSQVNDVLAIKQARRKRKPGSAPSAASGPLKYRTRSMVIVYYDSDIQDAFELLVRNIATARNNLRKGKTAATFKARMASLGVGSNSFTVGGRRSILDPKITRTAKRTDPDVAADNATFAFDAVDQDLEKAQATCESAAHQFLRDGDCNKEIQVTRESFQKCLDIAQKEVEKLREAKARETPETEDIDEKNGDDTDIDLSTRIEPPTVKPVEFAGIGTIEVDNDNSDAESVHIDMSAIRRMRGRV